MILMRHYLKNESEAEQVQHLFYLWCSDRAALMCL